MPGACCCLVPLQYAWDIGVAANRLNILNQGHPATPLISQPPHDSRRFNASMYHYTWGECTPPGVELACRLHVHSMTACPRGV